MKQLNRDPALDTLLYLDGVTYVVEASGTCWVKFEVKQVPPTRRSLTVWITP